jgi:L-ascorbate metabolism protein UlaG (beta-lactamase superfamily)
MKRRQLIQGAILSTVSLNLAIQGKSLAAKTNPIQNANTDNSVLIEWLGQMCFLFTGNGQRILVNPFRTIGCTAGYRLPTIEADIVLISSYLWDEGAVEALPGKPKIFYESGDFSINGLKIQGISVPHDREQGRRFGNNIAWSWRQGGVKILHLGGAAAPLGIEQKILMGRPDIALIPVGGGPKAYNPTEAKEALVTLSPKIMIPTQYLTEAADKKNCELVKVGEFLELVKDFNIQQLKSNQIRVAKKNLPPAGTLIRVLNSQANLAKTEKPAKKPS